MASMTAQQMARQRLATMDLAKFATKPSTDKRLRENRAKASRKYRATPKGKLTDSQKCMIYQRNHPEIVKACVMRYQSRWAERHGGIQMGAWNYWRRRLDRGEITPEDVPEKYEKCLNEWRRNNVRILRRRKAYPREP